MVNRSKRVKQTRIASLSGVPAEDPAHLRARVGSGEEGGLSVWFRPLKLLLYDTLDAKPCSVDFLNAKVLNLVAENFLELFTILPE